MTKTKCIYGIRNKNDFLKAVKFMRSKKWASGQLFRANDYDSSIYAIFDEFSGLTKCDDEYFNYSIQLYKKDYNCINWNTLNKDAFRVRPYDDELTAWRQEFPEMYKYIKTLVSKDEMKLNDRH